MRFSFLLGLVFGSVSLCFAQELPPFEVAEGLTVELAVKPGLVTHPMMASIDDRGRLFVAESAGVNEKPEELEKTLPHSIRMLTDTNGDGVWDKASTFADKLTFPQGALWLFDSLYVMSPPSLWKLTDADGDGVAEKREELVTGFDYTGNAADVHGPFLHPNGRLYWCHGRKGHKVVDPGTGELVSEAKGARIWTCKLNGSDLRVFAGGAMDNPVEIDFTPEGEIFGTVNLFYGRPRGDVLVHWLYGGAYPRHDQLLVLKEFPKTGELLKEVHNFGHVAISGMCRYRSGSLNPDWKGNWLAAHFNTGEISRTEVIPDGSDYREGKTETILKLNKPDVHFTDVLEDRNGDILALDTGGWFRIGCPTSQIAKPDVSGGIYRIRRTDGGKVAPPANTPENWEVISAEAVSGFLDADAEWVQERARTELAVRGHESMPELRRILEDKNSSERSRRNAVWTLARMQFSDSPDLIFSALNDNSDSVKQAACNAIAATRSWQTIAANQPAEREIELMRNQTIAGALAKLVRGATPAVARTAAAALGQVGNKRAVGDLLGRAGRDDVDRSLRHALTYALIELDDVENTKAGLSMTKPNQVITALYALSEMPSGKLEIQDVLPLLDSPDDALRNAAVSIAASHLEWDAALANRFFEWSSELNDARRAVIGTIVPEFITTPPMLDFLAHLLESENMKKNELALTLISGGASIQFQESWKKKFASILTRKSADNPLLIPALNALKKAKTTKFDADLTAIAEDTDISPIIRVHALQAKANPKAAITAKAFDMLVTILKDSKIFTNRAKAITVLTNARLTAAQKTTLAGLTGKLNPLELPQIVGLFQYIKDAEQAKILIDGITVSPGFRNLDPLRLQQIFTPFDKSITAVLDKKIAEAALEKAQRKERITSLKEQLERGNSARGKIVFDSGKGTCMVCHQVGETGRDVGPNLSTIGRIRKAEDLLESILYPSESIAHDFETFTVTMNDGSPPLMGIIRQESADQIDFIDPAGQPHIVRRKQVESITLLPQSLMPAGLDQALGNQDLLDLVTYLLSLK